MIQLERRFDNLKFEKKQCCCWVETPVKRKNCNAQTILFYIYSAVLTSLICQLEFVAADQYYRYQ